MHNKLTRIHTSPIVSTPAESLEEQAITSSKPVDSFDAKKTNILTRRFAVIPPRKWRNVSREMHFVNDPNYGDYMKLSRRFRHCFKELSKNSFAGLEDILIEPKKIKINDRNTVEKKLERWHGKKDISFEEKSDRAQHKSHKRERKIEAKGKGLGGVSSNIIYGGKITGRGIKDYGTMRGWMFQTADFICGQSLYELLPRYGYRNGGYIGIRVSEFALNTTFLAVGYALMPFTYGISKEVSDHARTGVTLVGEGAARILLGAQGRKVFTHTALRAVQLELPKIVPGGDIVQYVEMGAQGAGSGLIAVSHMADLLMKMVSTRYTSLLTKRDLGDSRVLNEIDQRILYLCHFLIPYGQWLLAKETDGHKQHRLRHSLKKQSKILRNLEKKRANALSFYQLALIGDRVPKKYRDEIMKDTMDASLRPLKNCHRIARRCLATLSNS